MVSLYMCLGYCIFCVFFFEWYGVHLDLHVLTHSFPTRRSADLAEAHRQFVLTWVQPGLAGLMDGSVSTLAPIFAAAFATGDTWQIRSEEHTSELQSLMRS